MVSSEELIPSVSRERNRDVAPREFRDEVGGDLRHIGKRLIVELRQAGNDSLRLLGRDENLGVSRAEILCYPASEAGFIVGCFPKTNRERANRNGALSLHQADHKRRVDPADQQPTPRPAADKTLRTGA